MLEYSNRPMNILPEDGCTWEIAVAVTYDASTSTPEYMDTEALKPMVVIFVHIQNGPPSIVAACQDRQHRNSWSNSHWICHCQACSHIWIFEINEGASTGCAN
jgi:hypothetical protein